MAGTVHLDGRKESRVNRLARILQLNIYYILCGLCGDSIGLVGGLRLFAVHNSKTTAEAVHYI